MNHRLIEGDALRVLPTLETASVDAVVCDPPYPCIDRAYGRWTEAEWMAMMDVVVPQCRRVLKPTGSAVFILQPNSERVGRMRLWLWRFLVQWGERWGVVQDAYWWNHTMPPGVHASRVNGLMRGSLTYVVWLGLPDCYRNQDAVLWEASDTTKAADLEDRALKYKPSGWHGRHGRACAVSVERGGVTPFNVLPMGNTDSTGGNGGHGAGKPLDLMRWWVRYLCPSGGIVLDPFAGSGTLAVAAACEGRDSVLIERHAPYCAIIRRRLADAAGPLFAATPPASVAAPQPTLFDGEDET